MNKNRSYLTIFSKVMIMLTILFIIYSYFNKLLNTKIITECVTAITLFSGIMLFYQYHKNKKILYISYLFFLISVSLSFVLLIILKTIRVSSFAFLVASSYMFIKTNKYLYYVDDKIFLEMLSKVLFFDERFKYKLSWIYHNENNYAKSIKALKNCKSKDSYYLLAINYEKTNQSSKAIEAYTRILQSDKEERPDIFYNVGIIFNKQGNYDEAIKYFSKCINCHKPDPKAYITLGLIKHEMGKKEEARTLFAKGKSLDRSLKDYIPKEYL